MVSRAEERVTFSRQLKGRLFLNVTCPAKLIFYSHYDAHLTATRITNRENAKCNSETLALTSKELRWRDAMATRCKDFNASDGTQIDDVTALLGEKQWQG